MRYQIETVDGHPIILATAAEAASRIDAGPGKWKPYIVVLNSDHDVVAPPISRDFIKEVAAIHHEIFGHTSAASYVVDLFASLAGLTEEVGEMNRAVLKRYEHRRGTDEAWAMALRKEWADVFVRLLDVADREGFDPNVVLIDQWPIIVEKMRNDQIGIRGPE